MNNKRLEAIALRLEAIAIEKPKTLTAAPHRPNESNAPGEDDDQSKELIEAQAVSTSQRRSFAVWDGEIMR